MFNHEAGMPPQDQTHRVYLSFQCRDGWHCQFLEADLKTPLRIVSTAVIGRKHVAQMKTDGIKPRELPTDSQDRRQRAAIRELAARHVAPVWPCVNVLRPDLSLAIGKTSPGDS
jgi:hypothetical protein